MPVLGDLRPSPRYVNNYWWDLRGRSPGLSLLAEHHWEAAVSSSQSERAFSMLTTMDVPNRRTMEELTLANTLFLRAKTTWTRLHRSCRQNRSEDILTTARSADSKTKAARLAESASTDAFATIRAAIAARSVGHKRPLGDRADDSKSEPDDSARDSPLLESGNDELSD